MQKPKAVIITGNPKFITSNKWADDFYNEIKNFLEALGYEVVFDPGEPHTTPPPADLWIGHSRGTDRLRFAPATTKIIALGSSLPGAINHPRDNTKDSFGPSDIIPNEYHYAFMDEMRDAIKKAAGISSGRN